LDGAIKNYQDAVAVDPSAVGAYQNIGVIQLAQGRRDEAEQTFRKAIEVAPTSVAARLALGNFLWASGRVTEAEDTFKVALQIDPKDADANRSLGVYYASVGRAAQAAQYFEFLARTTKTTAASLSLADYYMAMRRWPDARRVLQEVARQDGGNSAAAIRLASLDAVEGQVAHAHDRIHEVLQKEPKNGLALLLDTRLFMLEGKRDQALASASTVVANEPASSAAFQAHMLSGQLNSERGRFDEALKSFEQALRLQPSSANAAIALAELHLRLRQPAKTIAYAQEALDVRPDMPEARALLIRGQLASGDIAKAKTELATLQKSFPNTPAVAILTALSQLAQKQPEAARESYARALQLAPSDFEAFGGLVQLDIATGHAKEAAARMEPLVARPETPTDVLLLAANAYASAGNPKKAEDILLLVVQKDPGTLQAYTLLGGLYISQHRIEEAKDQFGKS